MLWAGLVLLELRVHPFVIRSLAADTFGGFGTEAVKVTFKLTRAVTASRLLQMASLRHASHDSKLESLVQMHLGKSTLTTKWKINAAFVHLRGAQVLICPASSR